MRKTLCEQQRSTRKTDEAACAELLAQRNRQIAQLTDMRKELGACQAEIRERQEVADGRLREREALTRSCDLARRQLVHLQGYRCKMKRAARVIRGSSSQLHLHPSHEWPPAAQSPSTQEDGTVHAGEAHDALRQHLMQLVRRSFTAEGALVDESIRFLRSSGATLQRLATTLRVMITDSSGQLENLETAKTVPDAEGSLCMPPTRDPAATRKMRALLTLAHGQHIAAYEEVETLRIEAHEARARADELVAAVEKQLSQVEMSDSEWRITSISMKQDRDLAAARASVSVVQSRLNDMKIKAQMRKETSSRLQGQRARLRTLESEIRDARGQAGGLVADIRRLLKLVHERNGDMTRFCEAEIVRNGPALQGASERARLSLMQHALQHSLAVLPETGQAHVDGDAGWHSVWHAVARAMRAPNSTTEHVLLQRVAATVQSEALSAAYITFGMAKNEAVQARAATGDWNSATTMANIRASLDSWESRWKRVVEDEVRLAVRTGLDAVERGSKLEDLVSECNEQPAQFAAPWMKVHGKNMYEWSLYLRSQDL